MAPYSFFVSFGLAIALGPPIYFRFVYLFCYKKIFILCLHFYTILIIYFSHYLTFNSIEMISNLLQTFCLPISITSILDQISPYFELPIGPAFILAFFIFDQGLCFYVHYFTPSKVFTFRETMTHFIWGFLNTKTYTMVIFFHLFLLYNSFHNSYFLLYIFKGNSVSYDECWGQNTHLDLAHRCKFSTHQ